MKKAKEISSYRPQIRSRHPSHNPLREQLQRMPFRSVIRLGSTTELEDGKTRIEINTPEAIRNSSSKLLMKACFRRDGVKTADWWVYENENFVAQNVPIGGSRRTTINELPFPIVSKQIFGSRGRGNILHKDLASLQAFVAGKSDLGNYIFERFYNYNKEYRLHVDAEGCFYTCRKMIKNDTPEDKRWFKNDSNSVWIMEENELFDKPTNWNTIIAECVKALNAVGLDFGAVDLRVQSSKDGKGRTRDVPDFIVVEINSAPSYGTQTLDRYLTQLPRILYKKAIQQGILPSSFVISE